MRIRFLFFFALLAPFQALSDDTLRTCTQNLFRLGATPGAPEVKQANFLAERIGEGNCDVITVQEIYGETEDAAMRTMNRFVRTLENKLQRKYDFALGETIHDVIRSGVLWDSQRFTLERKSSPPGYPPKLSMLGPPQGLSRKSLGVLLKEKRGSRSLFVVSFHFKSRVGGYKDPTHTDFETLRMESAEQVREWAQKEGSSTTMTIVGGDRNSPAISASALILQGALRLSDFRDATCKLTKALSPTCASQHPPIFAPLMQDRLTGLSQPAASQGSFRFRGKEELIDELHVSTQSITTLDPKRIKTRFIGRFGDGSDHKMIATELQW